MEKANVISRPKIHQGRNVRRFREMFGVKQEVLAEQLGISQQTVSRLESQEELDTGMLEKVAEALRLPAEAIRNFDEEAAFGFIANTWSLHDTSSQQFHFNFNAIDKIVELYNGKIELYERLLQSEKEKVEMLELLLKVKTVEK